MVVEEAIPVAELEHPEQATESDTVQIHAQFTSAQAEAADQDEQKVSAQVVQLPTAPHTSGGAH